MQNVSDIILFFYKSINKIGRIRYGLKRAFALQIPENDAYKPDNSNSPSQMADFYLFNYCSLALFSEILPFFLARVY